ncbi:MAG: hypothetical protein CRN43_17395, partial [Candidatus Nephrothrix sp. EaCA]
KSLPCVSMLLILYLDSSNKCKFLGGAKRAAYSIFNSIFFFRRTENSFPSRRLDADFYYPCRGRKRGSN